MAKAQQQSAVELCGPATPVNSVASSQGSMPFRQSWSDLPLELQEKIYERLSTRERRLFRRLNKACREHACHKLVEHLSIHASALAVNSLASANSTLAQRFSNLHTLGVVLSDANSGLAVLGSCNTLTGLNISINSKLTEKFCTLLSAQFPSLACLKLADCKSSQDTALQGLRTLVHLTSLAVLLDISVEDDPWPMLRQFPTELQAIQSLEINQVQLHGRLNNNTSRISLMHLTKLTRLVLCMAVSTNSSDATGLALCLKQWPCLQHLELPLLVWDFPTSWFPSLSQLTCLRVPYSDLDLGSLPAENDSPFPKLRELHCWKFKSAPGRTGLLPQCTHLALTADRFELSSVTSALQQCSNIQQLGIRADTQCEPWRPLSMMRQIASAMPATKLVLCHAPDVPFLSQALHELQHWDTLTAAHFDFCEELDAIADVLVASLGKVRSLLMQVTKATEHSVVCLCAGLPRLHKFVLALDENASVPFACESAEHVTVLLSELADRQLRISIGGLPRLRVWELNRDMQGLGCDGIRFDNLDDLELW